MKLSLDRIFCKVVYHHIIYMCDFLVNLDDFLTVVCTGFHGGAVSTIYVPVFKIPSIYFPLLLPHEHYL